MQCWNEADVRRTTTSSLFGAVRRTTCGRAVALALVLGCAGCWRGAVPADPPPELDVAPAPRTVLEFGDRADAFRAIDDRVMGGVSQSRMTPSAEGTGVFSGTLSRENNGGFASVRAAGLDLDLTDATHLTIRARGDGRTYKLRLHDDTRFDGVAFETSFETTPDEWVEHELPLDGFRPVWRGRLVRDAPPLDRSAVVSVGLMVSDGPEGAFRLELDALCANEDGTAR